MALWGKKKTNLTLGIKVLRIGLFFFPAPAFRQDF